MVWRIGIDVWKNLRMVCKRLAVPDLRKMSHNDQRKSKIIPNTAAQNHWQNE